MNKTGRPRSLLFTTLLLSWDTRSFAQPPLREAGDEPWVCGGSPLPPCASPPFGRTKGLHPDSSAPPAAQTLHVVEPPALSPVNGWEAWSREADAIGLRVRLIVKGTDGSPQERPLSAGVCTGEIAQLGLEGRASTAGYVWLTNLGTSGARIDLLNAMPLRTGMGLLPNGAQGWEVVGPPGTEILLIGISNDPRATPINDLLGAAGVSPLKTRNFGNIVDLSIATTSTTADHGPPETDVARVEIPHRAVCP